MLKSMYKSKEVVNMYRYDIMVNYLPNVYVLTSVINGVVTKN